MTIAELARAANGTSAGRAALDMAIGVTCSLLCLSAYAFLLWALSPAGDPRCDPFGAQPQAASCQHRIANAKGN